MEHRRKKIVDRRKKEEDRKKGGDEQKEGRKETEAKEEVEQGILRWQFPGRRKELCRNRNLSRVSPFLYL